MQVNDYESNIQQKLSTINTNEVSIPKEVENEVTLNSPMKVVLLNELKKNPDNPKIKDAILKYYKAKLELIQRIEEVLKKQDKTINNETDNSTVI
jgi:glutamine synthetase type III